MDDIIRRTHDEHICECAPCLQYRDGYMRRRADERLEEVISDLAWTIKIYPHLWDIGGGNGENIADQLRQALENFGVSGRMQMAIPRPEVVRIANRDGWDCRYCGCELDGKPDRPKPHIDHVIPKSQGGSNALSNKVLSCPTCNLSKGARTPEEWRAAQEAKRAQEQADG